METEDSLVIFRDQRNKEKCCFRDVGGVKSVFLPRSKSKIFLSVSQKICFPIDLVQACHLSHEFRTLKRPVLRK